MMFLPNKIKTPFVHMYKIVPSNQKQNFLSSNQDIFLNAKKWLKSYMAIGKSHDFITNRWDTRSD